MNQELAINLIFSYYLHRTPNASYWTEYQKQCLKPHLKKSKTTFVLELNSDDGGVYITKNSKYC